MKAFQSLRPSLVLVFSAILLCACNPPGSHDGQQSGAQSELNDVSLLAVQSNTELEQYLKEGLLEATNDPAAIDTASTAGSTTDPVPSAAPTNAALEAASAADTGTTAGNLVSGTNLQVAGVDEADLVKTDGKYLYIVDRPDGSRLHHSVRIMSIHSDPAEAVEVNRLTLDEKGTQITGLYLLPGQDGSDDLLVAVGSQAWGWGQWTSPWSWQHGAVRMWLYNVTDPENVTPPLMLALDGYLLSSRRVGDMLYLVSRYTPQLAGLHPYPANQSERDENIRVVNGARLTDMLPTLAWNSEKARAYLASRDCFLPDTTTAFRGLPTLTTITAINLRSPTSIKSVCFGGNATGFYASQDSIYITNTVGLRRFAAVDPRPAIDRVLPLTMTVVHKFSLTDEGPRYKGSGAVPGHLAGGANPSYLMGEREGYLNILTSWRGVRDWHHQLTVLQESSTSDRKRLEAVARLPNLDHPQPIGKPGEQIYAARYLGSRAYIVTFKKVDPLYVIDLHDQEAPVIAGELNMPGYSSYIHPIGDDLVLGIGKDAVPSESGDFAWYQGLKLALFDVSDMTAPQEVSTVVIGDRGTTSSLLYDFHALAYLAGNNGEPDRLALPVELHQYQQQPQVPWEFAPWISTGLHLFEIDDGSGGGTPAIKPVGVVVALDRTSVDPASDANAVDIAVPPVTTISAFAPATSYRAIPSMLTHRDRAVIQDSAVHYIHTGKVWSAPWSNPEGAYGNQ